MKTLLAVAILGFAVAGTADRAAACEHAKATQSAQVPAAGAGDATRADETSWRDNETALTLAMRDSDRPRDRALAARGPQPGQRDDAPPADPGPALVRAAQSAPNDALVQWLAANNHDSGSKADDARVASALARLTQLEPGNGAVWMLVLDRAARHDDAAGVADALAHMADSQRFDDHFVDTAHAWLEAYDRYPPATPLADIADGRTYRTAGFTAAFAKAAAVAMPSYSMLVETCKATRARGDSAAAAHCATAGRMMLFHGNTLIATHIGFAVLRILDVASEADRAARRDLDWYSANVLKGIGYDDGDAFAARAYESDWRRMDDEIEVIKSALRRAGLPTEAPQGWQSASSTTAVAAAR